MSAITRTLEEAEKEADTLGLVVHRPKYNELFIDVDTDKELPDFILRRLKDLCTWLPDGISWAQSRSKSGNIHLRVRFNDERTLTDIERIAWQAVLGSDPVREFLSMLRVEQNTESPVLFFEKPDFKVERLKWRTK